MKGRPGEEHQEHQYQRHDLGTLMYIGDREWRYAQMGGTAGVAGNLYQSEVPTSTWMTVTANVAQAIGSKTISATLGSTNASLEDEFNEGFVGIEDDAGEGFVYQIARAFKAGDANAAAAASAVQTVNLKPGYSLIVALTTASTLGFFKNKYDEVIIHPSPPTTALAGVAMRAVTANYYCWLQTRGMCMVLADGTLVIGDSVVASDNTNGAVETQNFTLSEGTPNTLDGLQSQPTVGVCRDIGTTAEYAMIDLNIP